MPLRRLRTTTSCDIEPDSSPSCIKNSPEAQLVRENSYKNDSKPDFTAHK